MRVVLARASGFCDGVKRAMRIALDAASRHGGLQSEGPLVHNSTAVDLLALHGISSSPEKEGLPLLVRAHGITPDRRRECLARGTRLVDATCVHVARNQRLAAEAAGRGDMVVIAGDPEHAEVKAVAGCAGSECQVVCGIADVESLPASGKILMLAQTTFNAALFAQMASSLQERNPDSRVVDTICRATHDRQEEARRLAHGVEAVVVVGGAHSANTRRLAEAVVSEGKPAFVVETAADVRSEDFRGVSVVGVTSGASTPGWITQEVVNRLRMMGGGSVGDRARGWLVPLVEYRLTTALSAAGLALTAQFFLTGTIFPLFALAGAGFVLFAHILNRRVPTNAEARRLSLADDFYLRRRGAMTALAWLGAALALLLSALGGAAVLAMFAAAIAAAAAYAWLVRTGETGKTGFLAFAPARNCVMAAGWALVLAAPPAFGAGVPAAGIGAGLFVFLICFGGSLIRDLHDIASDRLMGIATLPAVLGLRRARRLAAGTLIAAAILPLIGASEYIYQGGTLSAWFLFTTIIPCIPFFGLYLLEMLHSGRIRDAILLQAGVDAMGILGGVVVVIFA